MTKELKAGLPADVDSIIFDLDGTLWDSTYQVMVGWNNAFHSDPRSAALTVTVEDLQGVFGKVLDEIGAILLNGIVEDPKVQLEIMETCFPKEEEAIDADPPLPYEGMEEAFRILSERYKLFIVSNCQAGYIECFLRNTNFTPYVTGHLCPGDTGKEKAANIREIIETYHLSSAIYVGDTMGDFTATKEAGIPFVFAAYGFGDVPEPDAVISKPMDLVPLLMQN